MWALFSDRTYSEQIIQTMSVCFTMTRGWVGECVCVCSGQNILFKWIPSPDNWTNGLLKQWWEKVSAVDKQEQIHEPCNIPTATEAHHPIRDHTGRIRIRGGTSRFVYDYEGYDSI